VIVAARGVAVQDRSYDEQCERCEVQIANLMTIWRQRVTPRTTPQTGLHVWILTSGCDETDLADETARHRARIVEAVSSVPSTALRALYQDLIGPEKFLDIDWELAPYNPDLFMGHTSRYAQFYWLDRHEVR
jgi:lipoate synthase